MRLVLLTAMFREGGVGATIDGFLFLVGKPYNNILLVYINYI